MTDILAKLKQFNTVSVYLPSIKQEKNVQKVNINFQNKLQRQLSDEDREYEIAAKYLLHLNTTLLRQLPDIDLTYLDKISVINQWRSETKNIDFDKTTDISNLSCEVPIGNNKIIVKYKNPSLSYENKLLSFLLSESVSEFDFVFFDTFRFVKSISFDDDTTYDVKNLSNDELYDVFNSLNLTVINKINTYLTDNLKDIDDLRSLEGDLSFYTDL